MSEKELKIYRDKVIEAANECDTARGILEVIFPEVFEEEESAEKERRRIEEEEGKPHIKTKLREYNVFLGSRVEEEGRAGLGTVIEVNHHDDYACVLVEHDEVYPAALHNGNGAGHMNRCWYYALNEIGTRLKSVEGDEEKWGADIMKELCLYSHNGKSIGLYIPREVMGRYCDPRSGYVPSGYGPDSGWMLFTNALSGYASTMSSTPDPCTYRVYKDKFQIKRLVKS